MLLAIDTSTRMVGIALYDGASVIGEMAWVSRSYHTVELAPAVLDLLSKTKTNRQNLQAVGVALGPGSFTALRIGLAFAKGLALSLHIPVIGVPSFDVLAAAQPVIESEFAAVIEAGRKRMAVGWYQAEDGKYQSTGRLENLTIDEFVAIFDQPTRVGGELNTDLRGRFPLENENARLASPAQSMRRPAILAELAWGRFQSAAVDDLAMLSPIYLHHGEPLPG
ncbi:MAG: tRNA (adenosine(37)-N6)-threonylcarbamoyltransferase complex dimerization subunit type 1 TsaB [Anaerolineae bacterium]|nr:tRNA (adenosine(37)-N6)-threonylcarbamoyltransferase complex dimerization subunit type 1 TsaB [Anaerolineae bacterium]MBL6965210.1 tRNA (adenosine(37)-N6)-threonylcarbamoyltransferase complex dimerization subunit type 1 TsaB [Anaerolineales bacterium]